MTEPAADDPARLTDAAHPTGDAHPGDGTVGEHPAHGETDALRTAAHGREAAAAAADVSDDAPVPQETPEP